VRPLWRPRDNSIGISLYKKNNQFFSAVNFFQFLVIKKTLDPELDPDPLLGKMLDPYSDPHKISAD
jgi:hypothetical protein